MNRILSERELTFRGIVLAIFLTVLLALSNAYLALKVGILTSASIPAAILSMGILRLFKRPSVLENNLVQTAASAGEAIAGGIVYTIPALIIIQYWTHFDYWTNFFIAITGGVLGVLFSIPLRKILVHEPLLRFPEGQAIAEVLKSEKNRAYDIFLGGLVGALLELLQTGFRLIASNWTFWWLSGRTLFGFGGGFSATMVGAGYLIGFDLALSIFIGAVIAWGIMVPILSHVYPALIEHVRPEEGVMQLWHRALRYLGIGGMLFAGTWTFIRLIKPLLKSIRLSMQHFIRKGNSKDLPRTEQDIPMPLILVGVLVMAILIFLFFQFVFPMKSMGLRPNLIPTFSFCAMIYVLVVGFLFSVITAYFSGMVGVTASPGSSVIIAGMIFAAWLLLTLMNRLLPLPFSTVQLQAVEATTIIIGSVVTGIAAIANDNIQDLKVGHLLGATPWKQQLMLLLGVLVSSLVIPPVMQILFEVYGIAGVMPHGDMDIAQSLPAPTAAMMAAITEAVFQHTMPWGMMWCGAGIILFILIMAHFIKLERYFNLSILGIAMGMYLPLASSFPLFLGGLIAMVIERKLNKRKKQTETMKRRQSGTLIACGLVAGSALMDIVLAIPFSLGHSAGVLSLVGASWGNTGIVLGFVTTGLLAIWIGYRTLMTKS